jgi:hypothetical protein
MRVNYRIVVRCKGYFIAVNILLRLRLRNSNILEKIKFIEENTNKNIEAILKIG